ncbi:MAG: metalloregulator ArsR/SmtB family transcription factor [Phycisphaerae bacterium]
MIEQSLPDVFQALADPTRRAILRLLSGRRLPAGQIARHFPQRRPAISKHLTILKRSGLLDERQEAQKRLYSIRSEALTPMVDLLSDLKAPVGGPDVTPDPRRLPSEGLQPRRVPFSRPAFELEFD